MSIKWLNTLTVWWWKRKLSSLGEINEETIEVWIRVIRHLATKSIDIPKEATIKTQHSRITEYCADLIIVAKLFSGSMDIALGSPRTILIEDWLVNSRNYQITVEDALVSLANGLQHVLDNYNSTEETDFAASNMAQYSYLFITVRDFSTVCSRHIVG